MAMAPDVKAALAKKSSLKPFLRQQCAGKWELVVLRPDGTFTVYGSVEQAAQARARYAKTAPPAEPVEPRRRAPLPITAIVAPYDHQAGAEEPPAEPSPPPPRPAITPRPAAPAPPVVDKHYKVPIPPAPKVTLKPEPEPEPAATPTPTVVFDLRNRASTIRPGVNIVRSDHTPKERTDRVWQHGDARAAAVFDWSAVDLELKAYELRDRMRGGYPEAMGFWYLPEVLALEGMDFEIVETAMRMPERVEVRPESFKQDKGYPVLGFHRGDVAVIVGFREPIKPLIIAAYAAAALAHDTHRVNHVGGGGAKKREGLPSTPSALVKRLQELGAELTPAASPDRQTVVYRGQELGQISTGTVVPRDTVHTDWQRTQRKINAINQRGASTGAR